LSAKCSRFKFRPESSPDSIGAFPTKGTLQNTSEVHRKSPDYAPGWDCGCLEAMKPSASAPKKSEQDEEPRIAALETELEHCRQEMRSFSYSVSHDLRAPLRAIEGFARIISEDYSQALDEEGRKFIQHVLQNAQVMGSLIEGLLNYHRLNERPMSKSNVNMTNLTQEVLGALPKPANSPEIKVAKLPTVSADPALMRIAWEQLISNALKFSKRASTPVIEFGADDRDGEHIIWVKDNGVGFDMQYANKLFQMFQKLQKDPEFDGHGVGLALVRRVAERHNGRAWAEAAPNSGATFYFAVPK
jgi:light-regulated signal transduction histidine kinase (bacteriophytochrome)